MSLTRININDPAFEAKAFEALEQDRTFVITGLGAEFTQTVHSLMQAYQVFRDFSDTEKAPFMSKPEKLAGYSPFDSAFNYAGKTTDRFYINRDTEKKLIHDLPGSMTEFNEKLLTYTAPIKAKIFKAIETSRLKIGEGRLSGLSTGHPLMVLTHYLPVTQEKLKTLFERHQLSVLEDGQDKQFKSFEEHKDISIFSMLIYPENKSQGLKIKVRDKDGKKHYQSVDLTYDETDGVNILVLAGRDLKHLTNGALRGLTHTVVSEPLLPGQAFSRTSIGEFINYDPENEFAPLVKCDNDEQENKKQYEKYGTFFKTQVNRYKERFDQMALTQLPVEFFDQYPKEEDILTEKIDSGPIYTRKSYSA
jgi:hypothetical protein